jgi:hypothetical protein
MRKTDYVAETLSGFINITNDLRKVLDFRDTDPWGPWFRGHTQTEWDLRPKLYRTYGDYKHVKSNYIEDEIREEFIQRAPILCDNAPNGGETSVEWEWYFMMQHFGAPTRLLDWTDGALIALYFAVKDNGGLFDAAVWALDPYALNERVIRINWIIPPSAPGIGRAERTKINRWMPERFDHRDDPPPGAVAIYPTHTARRISTQRSCFTIHGTDPLILDKHYKRGANFLAKITIPAWAVQKIKRELCGAGIDESTIFPDLTGLSVAIGDRWKRDGHSHPHVNVYTRVGRSKIHGVGVFAIVRIKKGTRLFDGESGEMPWFDEKSLPKKPREIRRLYDDFAVIDPNKRHGCPKSFNLLTPSWYINEPNRGMKPNVHCDLKTYAFFALRDIDPGEELTVDYKPYSRYPAL